MLQVDTSTSSRTRSKKMPVTRVTKKASHDSIWQELCNQVQQMELKNQPRVEDTA